MPHIRISGEGMPPFTSPFPRAAHSRGGYETITWERVGQDYNEAFRWPAAKEHEFLLAAREEAGRFTQPDTTLKTAACVPEASQRIQPKEEFTQDPTTVS